MLKSLNPWFVFFVVMMVLFVVLLVWGIPLMRSGDCSTPPPGCEISD
jgi:hypothetical protein